MRYLAILLLLLTACSGARFPTPEPTVTPAPTADVTPTIEAEMFPVLQCLNLVIRLEPVRQLSDNPCLLGDFTQETLIASAEDVRHQDVPVNFIGVMQNAPSRNCVKGWHVHARAIGSSADARGYRADISEVCGRFGYQPPAVTVECNRNLIIKMTTWSSYFDIEPGKPSYVGLIMEVKVGDTWQQLSPIGIPNSGWSGNIRVVRFENCTSTLITYRGLIEVVWASAEGEITIQGIEILQPEDRFYGSDLVRVIRVS